MTTPTEGDQAPRGSRELSPEDSARSGTTEITVVGREPQEGHGITEKAGDTSQPQEIEYLYLTFETPLPTPAGISSPPQPGQSPPPECPDLKPYTSPFLWSSTRKTVITWISCAVTALAGYSAGEYAPATPVLSPWWNVSHVVCNLGITVFCIGFAIAPMVLAPFSEINGRRPMFVSSGILFTGEYRSRARHRISLDTSSGANSDALRIVCLIGCGATNSFAGMLVARFFQGVGGCTSRNG